MKKIKYLLLSVFLIVSSQLNGQTNSNCADMLPICANSTLVYPLNFAATGPVPQAQVGPNYGCLAPQPNPSWFYFEVATAGDIDMQMTCPVDIDYVIWGPFTSLASAQSLCGTMGVSPSPGVIDCNGLGGINNNMPSVTNASFGEVYVMMVTNFSNQNTSFVLTQTSGLGQTNCSSLISPCGDQIVIDTVPGTIFGVSCNGAVDGAAAVTASSVDANGNPNGIPIISYLWVSPLGLAIGGTAMDTAVTNLTPGLWTVVVTNLDGCETNFTILIDEPALITNNNSVVVEPGAGLSNGSIDIMAIGGTLPFVNITVQDANGNTYPVVGSMTNGLPPGTFIITIEDANGCTGSFTITLEGVPISVQEFEGPVIGSASISYLKLYPDPATVELNVSFELKESGTGTMRVFDLKGALLMDINRLDLVSGENTILLDLHDLPNGTYTIQLQTEVASQTQKFIKQ